MTTTVLLRAPRECGSWVWWPSPAKSGLDSQLYLAARLTEITAGHGALSPTRVNCRWLVEGRIVPRAWSGVKVAGSLDEAALIPALTGSRPPEPPGTAEPGEFEITGAGTWFDADGAPHAEEGLARLTVDATGPEPSVGLEVFHDIWMPYDFAGEPHPRVHERNAPRLAALLADINELLGVEAEPGEPTYFGHAVALGVENSADDDGNPLDVTDLIVPPGD